MPTASSTHLDSGPGPTRLTMEPLDYSSPERNAGMPTAPPVGMVLTAFITPPAVAWIGWLVTRLAIARGYWAAVPLFLLVLGGAALACLILAGWYAAHASGWARLGRFTGWIGCCSGLGAIGLAVIDLLPIAVGDAP